MNLTANSPLMAQLRKHLQEVFADCNALGDGLKDLQGAVAEGDPLWGTFAKLRQRVREMKGSALSGQTVIGSITAPSRDDHDEDGPAELHSQHVHARPAVDRKMAAANDHTLED